MSQNGYHTLRFWKLAPTIHCGFRNSLLPSYYAVLETPWDHTLRFWKLPPTGFGSSLLPYFMVLETPSYRTSCVQSMVVALAQSMVFHADPTRIPRERRATCWDHTLCFWNSRDRTLGPYFVVLEIPRGGEPVTRGPRRVQVKMLRDSLGKFLINLPPLW